MYIFHTNSQINLFSSWQSFLEQREETASHQSTNKVVITDIRIFSKIYITLLNTIDEFEFFDAFVHISLLFLRSLIKKNL